MSDSPTKAELIEAVLSRSESYKKSDLARWLKSDLEALVDKLDNPEKEEVVSKVVEQTPDPIFKVVDPTDFFHTKETVKQGDNSRIQFHLVKYRGIERWLTAQQIEIELRRGAVMVVDGTNVGNDKKYIEFPKSTKFVRSSKAKRPCIGCR